MKFLSAGACLLSCLAAVVLGDSIKVPGESPLEFCNANRDDDLVQIEKIDISPNPPKAYALPPALLYHYAPSWY